MRSEQHLSVLWLRSGLLSVYKLRSNLTPKVGCDLTSSMRGSKTSPIVLGYDTDTGAECKTIS